jgi:hypothetical protein
MAFFMPKYAASSRSNRASVGPVTYSPLSRTSPIAASSSAFRLWYWRTWP